MFQRMAAALAVVTLLLVAGPAASAPAHPFGPPLTAEVSSRGNDVHVVWNGAEDDWVSLGDISGAFATPKAGVTGLALLQESSATEAYFDKHVAVTQAGTACPFVWDGIENALETGAQMHFTCPAPVEQVELSITALTDSNSAYRTVVTAGGAQTLFTKTKPTQAITVTGAGGGPGATPLIAAGALLVLGVGALVWFATRRSRAKTTSQPVVAA